MARVINITNPSNGQLEEWYACPNSVKEGNEWLERVGATHLRFGTSQGMTVLRQVNNKKIIIEASNAKKICLHLAFTEPLMRSLRIPFRDWYCPQEAFMNPKNYVDYVTLHNGPSPVNIIYS